MAADEVVIHETALVHPGARLERGVTVGPYSIVEDDVVIGAGSRLMSHVVVHRGVRLGEDNDVRTGAILGMAPQDLKYKGERTELIIGNGNRIGEYCTFSPGTAAGRGETRIGDDNYMMAFVHIGHDCIVGNHTILTQNVSLAGMCVVDDHVVIGGHVGVHQFVRIGRLAMVGALSKVTRDVPPYVLVDGNPARTRSLNVVGLARHGIAEERRSDLRRVFSIVYKSQLSLDVAVQTIETDVPPSRERDEMLQFLRGTERGICR